MAKYDNAIIAHITVPDHIHAAAGAVRYDLLYGPAWVRVPQGNVELFNADCVATYRSDLEDDAEPGDVIQEAYTGMVAKALQAFIDDLPSELWVDVDCDCVMESEPEPYEEYENDDGEMTMQELDLSNIYHVDGRSIVKALFGKTIANEF